MREIAMYWGDFGAVYRFLRCRSCGMFAWWPNDEYCYFCGYEDGRHHNPQYWHARKKYAPEWLLGEP